MGGASPRDVRDGLTRTTVGYCQIGTQHKNGRFIFSQLKHSGWLGPGAPSYVPPHRVVRRGRYLLFFITRAFCLSVMSFPGLRFTASLYVCCAVAKSATKAIISSTC